MKAVLQAQKQSGDGGDYFLTKDYGAQNLKTRFLITVNRRKQTCPSADFSEIIIEKVKQ
jgi:hypothetical protein